MEGEVLEGNKIPALAGEKWREMSDQDKVPYKTKEAAAKKEHTKALLEWQKKVRFLVILFVHQIWEGLGENRHCNSHGLFVNLAISGPI